MPGKRKPEAAEVSSDSDSSEEETTVKKTVPKTTPKSTPAKKTAVKQKDSDSEEEVAVKPVGKKSTPAKATTPAKAAKAATTTPKKAPASKKEDSSEDDSSEDEKKKKAAPAKTTAKPTPKAASKPAKDADSDSSEDEKPAAKSAVKNQKTEESNGQNKRKGEEEEDDQTKRQKVVPADGAASKVLVGNLSFKIDEATLRGAFEGFDIKSVDWLEDKETGKFFGKGFITFGSAEDAQKALEKNGETVMDRNMTVEIARERATRGSDRGSKPLSDKPEGCTTIFVGGVADTVDESTIREFLKDCGEVTSVRWLYDKETGNFKGAGFVDFAESSGVDNAVALNGAELNGKRIRVDFSSSRPPSSENSRGGRGGGRGGFGGGRGGFGGGRGGGRGGQGGFRGGRGGKPSSPAFAGKKQTFGNDD